MIEPIRCVIIDDEAYAIELLYGHVNNFPELEVIQTYTDPIVALTEFPTIGNIDILFLDINMPELSGIDLAARIRNKVKYLIFTTAHPQYALQAFEVKANTYLLKPIDKLKFIEVINEIKAELLLEKSEISDKNQEFIFIRPGGKGKFSRIKLDDIILIQAEHNHIKIITDSASISTLESMKNIETHLNGDKRFIRVHKSFIVNTDKILKVDGNTIKLSNNWNALISIQYKQKFIDFIDINTIKSLK